MYLYVCGIRRAHRIEYHTRLLYDDDDEQVSRFSRAVIHYTYRVMSVYRMNNNNYTVDVTAAAAAAAVCCGCF